MKKFNLLSVMFALLLTFITGETFSQAWLPEPVKSPYLEAMSGTWVSEPYQYMGNTNNDVLTYKMILNGQFMEVEMKRSDDKGFTYEGKEIIKLGADGTLTGSFYDIFGKNRDNTYSGSINGSKFSLTSSSHVGTGTREIIIDGDTMIQNATFTMDDGASKQMPEQKITIVYKKR